MAQSFSLSVVIPVYNEKRRLANTFQAVVQALSDWPFIKEVFFVDDGSTDDTLKLLREFSVGKEAVVKIISYKPNRGKGYAVRKGMLAFSSDYCLMIDADMSTSFSELNKAVSLMKNKCPLIIGTRKNKGAVLLKKQPWYRQKMGEAYALIACLVTGLKIKDFGCGYKIFSKEMASLLFSKAFVDRWIFDTEILYLAKKNNISICEIGVNWSNDEDTRVSIGKDIFQCLKDLLLIYARHR